LETLRFVLTVAEGLVRRVPAPAKRERSAAGEAKLIAVLVDDCEIAFDADGSVTKYGYL
jgi:hypothetical protein